MSLPAASKLYMPYVVCDHFNHERTVQETTTDFYTSTSVDLKTTCIVPISNFLSYNISRHLLLVLYIVYKRSDRGYLIVHVTSRCAVASVSIDVSGCASLLSQFFLTLTLLVHLM